MQPIAEPAEVRKLRDVLTALRSIGYHYSFIVDIVRAYAALHAARLTLLGEEAELHAAMHGIRQRCD